jgi:hypothetical protein
MFRYSQKQLLAVCALAVGLAAAPAQAQVTATLVLKNGQRHTGQNLGYRLDRPEVAVRTSQHEEPRVPLDQVAYVDFGGTSDVNVDLSGSEQAVVMRNGSVMKGQIIELGHTNRADQATPYLVVFRTSGGEERRIPVNEVARVYFSGSNAVSTSGSAAIPGGTGIAVPANQAWTPTGITVRKGDVLTIRATGEARLSTDGQDIADATGSRSQRSAPNAPLPGNLAGTLIARVGNGAPFPIGNDTTVTMPANGQLFLGINDDNVADNSGGFRAEIQRGSNRRR